MNKITYSLVVLATLFTFTSCSTTQPHTAGSRHGAPMATNGCKFRIPMRAGCKDGGTYHDVSAWQSCLISLGYRTAPPNGYFDGPTQSQTEKLQADYGLPVTGIVDLQTFQAAEKSGCTGCTPVFTACPGSHSRHHKN